MKFTKTVEFIIEKNEEPYNGKYEWYTIFLLYDGGTCKIEIESFGMPFNSSEEDIINTAKDILI